MWIKPPLYNLRPSLKYHRNKFNLSLYYNQDTIPDRLRSSIIWYQYSNMSGYNTIARNPVLQIASLQAVGPTPAAHCIPIIDSMNGRMHPRCKHIITGVYFFVRLSKSTRPSDYPVVCVILYCSTCLMRYD